MRIGRLRHRLQLRVATMVKDPVYGQGGQPVWTNTIKVWAEPLPVSGVENVTALAAVGKQTMRWRIRYRTGLTTKMSFVYKGQAWDIAEVAPEDHQNKFLVLLASRGLTSGQ